MRKGKVVFRVLQDHSYTRCPFECYSPAPGNECVLFPNFCVNFRKLLFPCYNIHGIKILRYEERKSTV